MGGELMKRFIVLFLACLLAISPVSYATQNSIVIPDGSGYQVRTGFNNALNSLATLFAGPTVPNPLCPYQIWINTSTNQVMQANALGTSSDVLGVLQSDGTIQWNLIYGVPAYTDTGTLLQLTGNTNSYSQAILQNTNSGSAATADYVVSNNLGTATTYYADFGINSSGFTGTGSLNLPNASYLTATSGDLAIGTTTSNGIHFVVNNGATDAVSINSSGVTSLSTPLAVSSGGTGASTASAALSDLGAMPLVGGTFTGNVTFNGQLTSTVASGNAPFVVSSNTLVSNLNSQYLNGNASSYFATSGANSNITSLTGLTTAMPISEGGTGSTNASAALTALGAASSGANSSITSLSGLTTALPITEGGTGATSASSALASLGAIPAPSSPVQGNVMYYNGTSWTTLAPGTSGYYLQTQGASANPVWAASSTLPGSPVQGDIVYYNGSAWANLIPGLTGQVLQTKGSGANPTWAVAPNINFNSLAGYKEQVTSNTAVSMSTTNNPFTGSGTLSLTLNTGTSGANGLDTGTLAASTFYYTYIIYGTNGVACLMSLSQTAPTLPTGYSYFVRTGSILLDSSKYLMRTLQLKDDVRYVVTPSTNTASLPLVATGVLGNVSTPTYVSASISGFVPPTASLISLLGFLPANSGDTLLIAPNNSYGNNSSTNQPPFNLSALGNAVSMTYAMMLESTSIWVASLGATNTVSCLGWRDDL